MAKLTCDSGEMQKHFDDAGTTAELREDGRVAVASWPKPRWSNPSFLSEELGDWQASQPKHH